MCVSAGCEGCYNDVALAFTIMYGVAHEETYTYTSMDGSSDVRTCLFMFSSSSSCTNCFLVGMKNDCMYQKDKVWPQGMVAVPPNNEEKMRRAVEKYGYGWVKMCYCTLFLIQFCAMMNMKFHGWSGCMVEINCSETKGFIHYSKGVFTSQGGKTMHAVVVVGYGNVKGVDMWIVRNSWSAKWGDKVFFKV